MKSHVTQQILPGVDEGRIMNDNFKNIGKELQAARKELGLRTADVARELRISADYLRFLESGDFDQLPAPTYVSGFLRSYGKFIGLDGADLAGRFYAIHGDASSTIDYKLPVTAGPPQRSAPAVASLFVVLALIGYGGWYWFGGPTTPDATAESELAVVEIDNKQPGLMEKNAIGQRFEIKSQTTSATVLGDQVAPSIIARNNEAGKQSNLNPAEIDVSSGAGQNPINDAGNAARTNIFESATLGSNEPVITGDAAETVTLNITTAAPSPSLVTDSDAATELANKMARHENTDDAALTPSPIQQLVPGSAAALATSRDPDHEITIRATASSWVEIVRGDGTAILKKLMKTGETYVVDTSSIALYLSTGNAGGIELVNASNDVITIGAIGEIVRDLPLANNRLRERF
jgi:cytoskeleton protein RodZ